jgi:hypothetical protein
MVYPGFAGASYRSQSVNAATERTVNLIVETIQSKTNAGPAVRVLYPRQGLTTFASGLDGPPRCEFAQDGRAFAVCGSYLYEFNGVGGATNRGFVGQDGQPASIASNGHGGNQLLIISAGKGWIFNLLTDALTQVTSPSFPSNAVMCDFMDGYFIVMQAGTSRFYVSALNDGFVWDGTMVAQTSASSDTLTAIKVIHRNLWLIGSQRTEVWYNSGATFPFQPIPGALLEYGTDAPWSVAQAGDVLCMLGKNQRGASVVLRTQGYESFVEISDYAVSLSLSQIPDLTEAIGYGQQQDGHTSYVVTFPTTGPTWRYDLNEECWAQDGEWSPGLDRFLAARPSTHMFAFGKHLVGDHTLGIIYEQSNAYLSDNGTPIRRMRTCPHMNAERQWMFYSQFWLDMEVGLGNSSDPNPQVMLRYSKDGGHTYSQPLMRSCGAGGLYNTKVSWVPFAGRARDLVVEVSSTALVPQRWLNAYVRVEPGLGLS